jgi:hypothetical protein
MLETSWLKDSTVGLKSWMAGPVQLKQGVEEGGFGVRMRRSCRPGGRDREGDRFALWLPAASR